MKLFNKKSKTILYKKFKQQQASIEETLMDKENQQIEEKEKKKGNSKKRDYEIEINATLLIAVCSLSNGTGCTHLVKSLAYYIKHYMKKTVCIVDIKGKNSNTKINGIEVYGKENLYELYDNYNFILLDVGNYDSLSQKEVKMAQIRIMCAKFEESYVKKLDKFVREEENSNKWIYIFNFVLENQQIEVFDLMEDFQYWCMPVNDSRTFNKDMKDKLERIVRGIKL